MINNAKYGVTDPHPLGATGAFIWRCDRRHIVGRRGAIGCVIRTGMKADVYLAPAVLTIPDLGSPPVDRRGSARG